MTLTVTLLGTGTSAGIPMIGCTCAVCTSDDPRDRRDRCSALVQWTDPADASIERTVLIDTSPELRQQMIRHHVMRLDAVLYTHNHADHIFGIDDLRRFNAVMDQPLDVYAEPRVLQWLTQTFRYIFEPESNVNKSFIPTLVRKPIEADQPFEIAGKTWQALRLMHGRLPVLGFRVGGFAYCTDCSKLPPQTYEALENLDVLVIDGLRHRHHPTHMTITQALEVIDQVQPRRAYLTHIAHDIAHRDLEAELPPNVMPAHDGLTLKVNSD